MNEVSHSQFPRRGYRISCNKKNKDYSIKFFGVLIPENRLQQISLKKMATACEGRLLLNFLQVFSKRKFIHPFQVKTFYVRPVSF